MFRGFAAAAQDCTQIFPLNILDQKTGNAVGLPRRDVLQARMGDTAIPITGLERAEKRRVLVLVDQSGSMATENSLGQYQKEALAAVEETMDELASQLPAGTSMAYGFFNDQWVFMPEFLSDPGPLREAIAETRKQLPKPGKGSTSLFDALHQAMLQFGTPRPGDTIILFTDTGENKSKLHPAEVEKELRRSGLRLVLLLLEQHVISEQAPYLDIFLSLAEDTGGAIGTVNTLDRSWLAKKDSEANREALRKFWTQEALNGYLLQVQVPAALRKPKKWSLRINPANDPSLKHVSLKYPGRLTPCPVSTAVVH